MDGSAVQSHASCRYSYTIHTPPAAFRLSEPMRLLWRLSVLSLAQRRRSDFTIPLDVLDPLTSTHTKLVL